MHVFMVIQVSCMALVSFIQLIITELLSYLCRNYPTLGARIRVEMRLMKKRIMKEKKTKVREEQKIYRGGTHNPLSVNPNVHAQQRVPT